MGHYGIVYIARNDQHPPNVYKIGGSSRDVDERMRELSNETATYGTFEAKAFFPVTDWEQAEASCHYQLDEYRDDKEFFVASYNELLEMVRSVCEDYQPEAHADKPTDGMAKALFLEPASLARPDPQHVLLKPPGGDPVLGNPPYDKSDWSARAKGRTNAPVKSQHKAEKKKDREKVIVGFISFIVAALMLIFIIWVIIFLEGVLIKINEPNALASRSENPQIH